MMISYGAGALFFLALSILTIADGRLDKFSSEARRFIGGVDNSGGTKWAVLVAGSNGYENYRHQADVCHAYHVLKRGGLKDENIIVFMYDDIAYDENNPRPGIIVNRPNGEDVYKGVHKDYTRGNVTAENFFAVLLGNKSALTGGSGKVVDSGPNDHIFIYYTDHGGPGFICMPEGEDVSANDLIKVLKQMHASKSYKSLVFYLEACESGSMFIGLPEGLNIYATTAANSTESSYATYCQPSDHDPLNYGTCLGDLYSIAWMEDCDSHNLQIETLKEQYIAVKNRTKLGDGHDATGSNVMQFGDLKLSVDTLSMYMGANKHASNENDHNIYNLEGKKFVTVDQRDADLVHFWHKFNKAPEGSAKKSEARKQLVDNVEHRKHVDESVKLIENFIFGNENENEVMMSVRSAGQPLVDDWDRLKSLVRTFETHCGSLSQYGMKHMRSFANICNAGVKKEQMAKASAQACPDFPSNPYSSLSKGFSV